MAMTLQQIKDEYAKEKGAKDWWEFVRRYNISLPHQIHDEIAKLYARECCKATLEKAAENAESEPGGNYEAYGPINRASIADPSNIVLL